VSTVMLNSSSWQSAGPDIARSEARTRANAKHALPQRLPAVCSVPRPPPLVAVRELLVFDDGGRLSRRRDDFSSNCHDDTHPGWTGDCRRLTEHQRLIVAVRARPSPGNLTMLQSVIVHASRLLETAKMATAPEWDWINEPRFWDDGPLIPAVRRCCVWLDRILLCCKVWVAVSAWVVLMRMCGNL